MAAASPPSATTPWATASAAAPSMSAMTTAAPSPASDATTAAPMPCAPPVTMATRPSRRRSLTMGRSEPAELAQPGDEEAEAVVEAHRLVPELVVRRVRTGAGRAVVAGRGLGDRVQGRAERVDDLLGCGAMVEVFDPVVDAGDLARPVAGGRRADLVLGPAREPVPPTGDTAVERGDRTRRDIGGRDPRDREGQVRREAPAQSGEQDPVEAGAVQRALGDEPGTEDRARGAGQPVVALGRPPVHL